MKKQYFKTKDSLPLRREYAKARAVRLRAQRYAETYKLYEHQQIRERVATEFSIKSMRGSHKAEIENSANK